MGMIATCTQDPSSFMYYGWNVAAPASNVMMVESAAYSIVLALSTVKALVFKN
jgi:hypothetical protein